MRATYYTSAGPVRSDNQDALLIGADIFTHTPAPYTMELTSQGILAVADGMGGAAGGDIAALTLLRRLLQTEAFLDPSELSHLCELAGLDMRSMALKDASLKHMGTVVAGIAWGNGRAQIFNCGDSRVYFVSPEHMVRLTHDHTAVQKLYDKHELDDEGQRLHPRRHILTSAVSANSKGTLFQREISLTLLGRLFICSDGVWEALPADQLREVLTDQNPRTAATRLVAALNCVRATDNISFVVIDK